MKDNARQSAIAVLTAMLLAFSYVGIGFGVVSGSPEPTRLIASATVDDAGTAFYKEQLVEGAVATQDYSFASHDLEKYLDAIASINAKADTPYAEYGAERIQSAPEQFAITPEQIRHLDDVYEVANRFLYPILGIVVLTAFLLMAGYRLFGISFLSKSLIWSGIGTIAVMLILLVWALISFDSLFAIFHSLFFVKGTWTFRADSLLITMLPEAFWIGIGGVWVGITMLLSASSIIVGFILKRRMNAEH